MPDLSRTRAVLHRYVDPDDPESELGGGCTYLGGRHTVVSSTTVVGDMGDPDTITVTIEPGDLLNA